MTCTRCAGEVSDGSQFCNHCGAPIQGRTYAGPRRTAADGPPKPIRSTPILIALLLVFGMIAAYRILKSPSPVRAPTGNEAEPSPTKPVGGGTESSIASAESPLNSDLTPAEFTIGPGSLRFFKIIIDEHTRMAVLEGKFSAKGGAYDDIEVFVFGRDTSMRPGEGLYAKALYKSNRVSTQVLDVPLSPGEYYLVFSNAWSPSVKTISAQVTIRSQPQ